MTFDAASLQPSQISVEICVDTNVAVLPILANIAPLMHAGESMTQEALDKRCEIWLDRMFGQRLDFAIENSLPVCLEDGIIKRDSQVWLRSALLAW